MQTTDAMNIVINLLPILVPLLILQMGLMIFAIVHAIKHQKFKFGNLALWIILIILLSIIGSILYFTIGRGETNTDEYEEEEI